MSMNSQRVEKFIRKLGSAFGLTQLDATNKKEMQ